MRETEFGELVIADVSGDRKLTWKRVKERVSKHTPKPRKSKTALALAKSDEPEDLQRARLAFDEAMKAGRDAYALERPGDLRSGRKITKFDPDARFITIMPKLSPGKY